MNNRPRDAAELAFEVRRVLFRGSCPRSMARQPRLRYVSAMALTGCAWVSACKQHPEVRTNGGLGLGLRRDARAERAFEQQPGCRLLTEAVVAGATGHSHWVYHLSDSLIMLQTT